MNTKSSFKIIGFIVGFIILLFIGLVIYRLLSTGDSHQSTRENRETYVVLLSRQALSEQEVLGAYGRNAVLEVSDYSYRLRLNTEQYAKFANSGIKYTLLSNSYPISRNGNSIWKIKIIPPVYNSKVQLVANYGTIIEELPDMSYLVWTNKEGVSKIDNLEVVDIVAEYLAYERVSIDLNNRLNEDDFTADINVLVVNNDIESIKNTLRNYGVNIIEEEAALLIDSSLSTVVLNTRMNYEILDKALSSFPQIISVK